MTPTVLELAEEFFPNRVVAKSPDTYQITGPVFDSVVIFDATNSYCRFSNKMVGGPREFLHYIVGLSDVEIHDIIGEGSENLRLFNTVRQEKTRRLFNSDTGLSLQDVVSAPGYNSYMESRHITELTAKHFRLEHDGLNVTIPLTDVDGRRIGSLVRQAHVKSKADRYRTYMVGSHEKPCAWPMGHIRRAKRESIIVLVEGAWSVMRIQQVISPLYKNILPIATLGTWLTDELRNYLYDKEILAILDTDEGGKTVTSQLKQWRESGVNVECYDITLQGESAYVDDISDAQLTRLFKGIEGATQTKLWNTQNRTSIKLVNRFGMIRQAEKTRLSDTS